VKGRGTGHPGLAVAQRVVLRRWRRLPVRGEVLIAEGQVVKPDSVIARAERTGTLTPVNVARSLDLPPHEVPAALLKRIGDRIDRDEEIARTAGFFGLFRSRCLSPVAGRLASVSARTGQILVTGDTDPLEVQAFIAGKVIAVDPGRGALIEGTGSLVQGVLGIGQEVVGPLVAVVGRCEADLTAAMIGPELSGAVLIGGGRIDREALQRAAEVEVAAVVAGGIEDEELTAFIGTELTLAVTGDETVKPTVVITGGFGPVPMERSTFDLLTAHAGELASVSGRTRVRVGAVRPEIVIAANGAATASSSPDRLREPAGQASDSHRALLAVGRRVRLVGADDLGLAGTVVGLPTDRRHFPGGGSFAAVEVRLESGSRVTVPRSNVELI